MTVISQILLVDDDEITNMLLEHVIRKSGRVKDILSAVDGAAALVILEGLIAQGKPVPELILLDVNMPGMGGFEFLDQYEARGLAQQGQMIIVMLSTSLLPEDHARAAEDPNVRGFANKPFDTEAFEALLSSYIAHVGQPAEPAKAIP